MSASPTSAGYLDIVVKSTIGGLLIALLLSLARLRR